MDDYDLDMDNIGSPPDASLLAAQVAESRVFFLQLAGPWRERVSVVLGGWERCRADYAVARTRYPYLVLELVTGGRGRCRLDGTEHRLEAGVCFASGTRTACQIETDADAPLEKFFFALAGPGAARAVARAGLLEGQSRGQHQHGLLYYTVPPPPTPRLAGDLSHYTALTRYICMYVLCVFQPFLQFDL